MLSKNWFVVLAVLGLLSLEVGTASAAGRGAIGSRANAGQWPRGENGLFRSTLGYGNASWGWGGTGYGYGYPGWGFAPWIAGYGYELEGVPYFSQFPPVYYGYEDHMPVVKSPTPQPASFASPSRPPLRIVNPYYVEEKTEKP